MKHFFPSIGTVLLSLLMCGCVYESVDECPAYAAFYCSSLSGNKNTFYEDMRTDMYMHFYQSSGLYRTEVIASGSHDLQHPLQLQKSLVEGELETVVWSADDALEYDSVASASSLEGSTVRLKEMEPGSGLCRPVDDLFYCRTSFTSDRLEDSRVSLSFSRPICRMSVNLISSSIQTREGGLSALTDYSFRIHGTYGSLRYSDGATCGPAVVLVPYVKFDEATGELSTDAFGAFGSVSVDSPEVTHYLKVEVMEKGRVLAVFDCTPLELVSRAGEHIELVVDGRYIRPRMTVYVNSWRVAIVDCSL